MTPKNCADDVSYPPLSLGASAALVALLLAGCATPDETPIASPADETPAVEAPAGSEPSSEAPQERVAEECADLPYASLMEQLLGTGERIELQDVSRPSTNWPDSLELTCRVQSDDGAVAVRTVAIDYDRDSDPCDLSDILKFATSDGDGAYNTDVNDGWVYYLCASDGALIRARYFSSVEAAGPSLEQIRDLAQQAGAAPELLVAVGRSAQAANG